MDSSSPGNALLNPRGAPALSPRSQPSTSPMPYPAMASSTYSTPPEARAFQFSNPQANSMFTDFAGMDYERTMPQLPAQQTQHLHHITPLYVSNPFGTHNGGGTLGGLGTHNGLASQVERLNNVQERISAPQPKRRKTQSEYDPPHAGLSLSSLGHSMFTSVTGQQQLASATGHQERPIAPASLTPRPAETVVDLTENDVGEVKAAPNEQPREEEVCYGMVEGATILCTKVPVPKPGMVAIGGEGYWPQIKVILRWKDGGSPGVIPVWDISRKVFGTLDEKTAVPLAPLLDSTLRIRTDALIPSRKKDPTEVAGQPIAPPRSNKVALMIYGPRKYANTVGTHLSKNRVKLVSPLRVEPRVKVFNPLASENRAQLAMRTPGPGDSRPPQHTITRSADEVRSEVFSLFDSLQKSDDLPEMVACDLITTPLMKHQRQGLYFMTSREGDVKDANELVSRSTWRCGKDASGATVYRNLVTDETQPDFPQVARGGLLADMMGLGKTLSILSLITSTLDDASIWAQLPPSQPQVWEKKPHQHPSQSFHPPKPPQFGLTPLLLNSKATLLISPLTTITNWEEQIKCHIKPGGLSYYIYHGPSRIKDPKILAEYDLVITTYGSVSSELNSRHRRGGGKYPLEEIGWFRIVLDEAHTIREQNTLAFKAICRLQASRRWAVTGTPVQNKLEDLGSLLAFIRVKPFDERSKFVQHIIAPFKNANPEIVPKLRALIDTITLRRLKDKINLPKRTDLIVRLDFDEKEQQVYDWFANNTRERIRVLTGQGGHDRIAGKAMIHILRSILQLRLVCAHGKDLLNADGLAELQGMTADTPIDLSDDEDEKPMLQESKAYEYFYLMQQSNSDSCTKCHNRLGSGEIVDEDADKDNQRQDDVLGYMSPTECFHIYCPSCFKTFGRQNDSQRCPTCCSADRSGFVKLDRSRATLEGESKSNKGAASKNKSDKPDDEYVFHSKTRALVDDLLDNRKLSQQNPTEPPYKSVVFSGWTSHLDLIQRALESENIKYTRLDGKMSRSARTAAMDAFREDPAVQVILVSIMAGGLGLNLTAGNSVYVMEPQYNPAAEAQAIDRVHRLGQKREVKTVRYIMRNSFEERMLDLQDKKTKLATLSLDDRDKNMVMDRPEGTKQRLMDLRSLFR
ncbi:SNF2 family N-terminal domain-containing protein [Podospora conica]|nr:SNF2 family N-terminal domain-containing protein [Schizothecium conicum]